MAQVKSTLLILLFVLYLPTVYAAQSELMGKALEAEGEQRWDDALAIYEQILAKEPNNAEVWISVADINATLGRNKAFVKASREAVRLRPTDPQLRYRLSQAYGLIKQPRSALAEIKQALQIAPSNPDYLLQQAELAFWLDDYGLAKKSYRAILKNDPNNKIAREGLNKVISAQPTLTDLALKAEGEQRWNDALSLNRKILAKNPDDVDAWIRMADIHANLGQIEAFLAASKKASALRPEDAQLQYRLSQAYGQNKMPEQGLEAVKRALFAEPSNLVYLQHQAELAVWLGDYPLARSSYQTMLSIEPGNTTAQTGLNNLEPAGNLPGDALNAEGEKRWQDALKIYYRMVKSDPAQPDLWLRIANIHTTLGETALALRAKSQAARYAPDDAPLHYSLAQEYSANNQPEDALVAIRQALALDPDNLDYLRLQTQLAEWVDDTELAGESYERLLALDPQNAAALLGKARLQSREGALDMAVQSFEEYLDVYPDDAAALLYYAETEIYRGEHEHAYELLQRYRSKKGEDHAYQVAIANFHARTGRPQLGLHKVDPLLDKEPENYDLNLINTIALNQNRQKRAALASLSTLDRLGPMRPETRGSHLEVETALRPYLGGGFSYSSDTDDIRILRTDLFAGMAPTPESRIKAGLRRHRLTADNGSGLEPLSGSRSIELDEAWISGRYQFYPWLAGGIGIGRADNGRDDDSTTFNLDVQYWPTELLSISTEYRRDVIAASPRAVEAYIPRDNLYFRFSWEYNYSTFLDGELQLADHDDGNSMQLASLYPRWAYLRSQKHNLDLGLMLQWFSFDKDLNNGYYDPDRYERLWGVAYYYWKISDNDGVSVVLGAGPERDKDLDGGYELGGNLRVEGLFGIYRDWQFRTYAETGGRFSDSRAGSAAGRVDAYRGYNFGAEIIRRF